MGMVIDSNQFVFGVGLMGISLSMSIIIGDGIRDHVLLLGHLCAKQSNFVILFLLKTDKN